MIHSSIHSQMTEPWEGPDSMVSSPTVRRRATSRTALVSLSQSLSPSSPPAQILVAQQSDGSPTGYLC